MLEAMLESTLMQSVCEVVAAATAQRNLAYMAPQTPSSASALTSSPSGGGGGGGGGAAAAGGDSDGVVVEEAVVRFLWTVLTLHRSVGLDWMARGRGSAVGLASRGQYLVALLGEMVAVHCHGFLQVRFAPAQPAARTSETPEPRHPKGDGGGPMSGRFRGRACSRACSREFPRASCGCSRPIPQRSQPSSSLSPQALSALKPSQPSSPDVLWALSALNPQP